MDTNLNTQNTDNEQKRERSNLLTSTPNSNSSPLVSITLATRNNASFLPATIESVLHQTYTNWELIIVDDGSTDNTEDYLKKISSEDKRISYTKNKTSLGISKSRNLACAQAKGEFIAVIDSDDIWTSPDKLAKQVVYLLEHPECEVVGTFAKLIDEDGEPIKLPTRISDIASFTKMVDRAKLKGVKSDEFVHHTEDKQIRSHILARQQFIHSTVVFRTKSFHEVGGYDESLTVTGDYDLILKLGCRGRPSTLSEAPATLHNIPEFLSAYRIHTNNITKRKIIAAHEHLTVIRRYKNKYNNYFPAYIKAKLRILKAIL